MNGNEMEEIDGILSLPVMRIGGLAGSGETEVEEHVELTMQLKALQSTLDKALSDLRMTRDAHRDSETRHLTRINALDAQVLELQTVLSLAKNDNISRQDELNNSAHLLLQAILDMQTMAKGNQSVLNALKSHHCDLSLFFSTFAGKFSTSQTMSTDIADIFTNVNRLSNNLQSVKHKANSKLRKADEEYTEAVEQLRQFSFKYQQLKARFASKEADNDTLKQYLRDQMLQHTQNTQRLQMQILLLQEQCAKLETAERTSQRTAADLKAQIRTNSLAHQDREALLQAALTQATQEHVGEVSELKRLLEEVREEVRRKTEEIEEVRRQSEAVRKEEADKAVERLWQLSVERSVEVERLQAQIHELRDEALNISIERDQSKQTLLSTQERAEDIDAKLKNALLQLQEEKAAVQLAEERINKVLEERKDFEQQLQTSAERQQQLQSQLEASHAQIVTLHTQRDQLQESLRDKQVHVDELLARAQDKQAQTHALQMQSDTLQVQRKDLQVQLANLQTQLANLHAQSTVSAARSKELEGQVKALQVQLQVQAQEHQVQVDRLQGQATKHEAQLRDQHEQLLELQQLLRDAQTQLRDAHIHEQGLQLQTQGLRVQVQELQVQLQVQQAETRRRDEEVRRKEEEIEEVQRQRGRDEEALQMLVRRFQQDTFLLSSQLQELALHSNASFFAEDPGSLHANTSANTSANTNTSGHGEK